MTRADADADLSDVVAYGDDGWPRFLTWRELAENRAAEIRELHEALDSWEHRCGHDH